MRCGKSSSVPSTRSTRSGQAENGRRPLANPNNSVFPNRANDQRLTANDFRRPRKSNENRLEQVLKSTDLILQSGGFGLVALDLAGIPEKFVRRIPLASWFRFQRAVEHTKTALLVISEFPCAQTCATLVIKVCNKSSFPSTSVRVGSRHQSSRRLSHAEVLIEPSPRGANETGPIRNLAPEGRTNLAQRFSAGKVGKRSSSPVGIAEFSPTHPSHAEVFKEMQIEAEILRSRLDRKPMQSVRTNFLTQAVRAG